MTTTITIPQRRLGRTNLMVTEMALGCYMFTGEFGVAQGEASAILDLAFDSGINYADTAAMYGFGEGEELVARALARHADQAIYVSTKVGWLDRTVVRNLGETAYRDEAALLRAIKHSLWLLRRERVEVLLVHEPDWPQWGFAPHTGDAPILNVLEELKRQGVIDAIGLGGWNCDNIADLLETGRFDVALVAGGYTLVEQPVRARVLPAAQQHDVGVVMGGAFLQGLLATIQRERIMEIVNTGAYSGRLTEPVVRRVLAIYDLCEETGISITELALRYILHDPRIHTVIPGAQQVSHLRENLQAAAKGALPAELVARIEAINQ